MSVSDRRNIVPFFQSIGAAARGLRGACLAGSAIAAIWAGPAGASFFVDPNPGAVGLFLSAQTGVTSFAGNVGAVGAGPLIGVTTTGAANTALGYAYITPAGKSGGDDEEDNESSKLTTYSSSHPEGEGEEGGGGSGLTLLRFTPNDPSQFANFSLRGSFAGSKEGEGEDEGEGSSSKTSSESKPSGDEGDEENKTHTLTLRVQDNQGNPAQIFNFDITGNDFGRLGIISTDGESIKWVEVESDGFSVVRDVDFSLLTLDYCTAHPGACGPNGEPPVQDAPEPASLTLFGLGLAGLGLARRRRRARPDGGK